MTIVSIRTIIPHCYIALIKIHPIFPNCREVERRGEHAKPTAVVLRIALSLTKPNRFLCGCTAFVFPSVRACVSVRPSVRLVNES